MAVLKASLLFVLGSALASADPPAMQPQVANTGQGSLGHLTSALDQLHSHLQGNAPLAPSDLQAITATIIRDAQQVDDNADALRRALRTVEAYESKSGPLFMNADTRNGFPRKEAGGLEVHRAMFALQQALIDLAYSPANLVKYKSLLEGTAFKTSDYFPGPVGLEPNLNHKVKVKINATQPAPWGSPVMFDEDPARRPTGCYLAPGSFATVTVPPSLVGKGFLIRVGAHSWDLQKKPVIKRLDRVSLVFPIEAATTLIANPLGGGIYIEVPPQANAGQVEVTLSNIVRAPFFSSRSFDKTTLATWRETERKHPAPWADFESDRFMMQVPTKWIYALDDPAKLIKDWDKALDIVSGLFGYPEVRPKSVLYLQVDVVLRGGAFFPGYPQSNFMYNPHAPEKGLSDHWLLKGPQSSGATIFHELGHAQLFTKFRGEVEAAVNLPYVAVLNKGFGVDLDVAFGRSFDNPAISLDQAAIMWMVTPNFRDGKPMDISNSEANEVRYQHRGYAKYVETARTFGWETLESFWKSYQLDYMKGERLKDRNADSTDSRILRLSKCAGVDMTPLVHFWGVHPEKPAILRESVHNSKLLPSAKIYDRLTHYLTLIPMNGEEFARHANTIYPKGIHPGRNPNYGEGWYESWLKKYDRSHGESARTALKKIIDMYFPEGRPKTEQLGSSQEIIGGKLFTLQGTDPTSDELLKAGKLPSLRNTTEGVTGSKVNVSKQIVEATPEAKNPIARGIRLHTLLNSSIPRKDFSKWSRWYQEDGNTQIFRLFKGEVNRRNSRPLAARVESFSDLKWTEAQGKWHKWSGVVTAINPVGMNLQVRNSVNDWAVSIVVLHDGQVKLDRRRGQDEVIAQNMIGKPFLLKVRDNGRDYEVFFNDKKVGVGSFVRPTGTTSFRWGMYVGANEVKHDAMIFFSGVRLDGND